MSTSSKTNSAKITALPTDERRAEIKEVFSLFDKDKSGVIAMEDLKYCLRLLNILMDNEQLEEALLKATEDKETDDITLEILQSVLLKGTPILNPAEELRFAFENFDPGQTGFLTKEQVEFILTAFGHRLDEKETKKLMDICIEKTEAGTFDYIKFINTMTQLQLLPNQMDLPHELGGDLEESSEEN